MKDTTCNGWTNYETWLVKLHIDNDQGSQTYWQERIMNLYSIALADNIFTKEQRASLDLADELKEEFEDNYEDTILGELSPMFSDLLNAALGSVNWDEIAKAMVEDEVNEREYQKEKVQTK